MQTKTLQKTNLSLLSLFCAANFDKNRIAIADHELSENFLTLWLENKQSPAPRIDDAVMYKLPVSKFAEIIEAHGLNSYEGVKFSHSGRAYADKIEINEPIAWFEQDATTYDRNAALEVVKECILKSSLKN